MSQQTESKKNTDTAKWSGSLGFIMAAAGSAVGMGNLWRFPMLVGENGGRCFCSGVPDLYFPGGNSHDYSRDYYRPRRRKRCIRKL